MPNQNQEGLASGEPTGFTEPLLPIPQENSDGAAPIEGASELQVTYPGHEMNEPLVGGHEVEPLAGMRTVEGTVTIRQWLGRNRESRSDQRAYPVRVRMAVGSLVGTDETLNGMLAKNDGHLTPEDMGYLFTDIMGKLTEGNVYGEVDSSEPGAMALNEIIEAAQASPHVPVTLVHAHGGTKGGEHHLFTGSNGDGTPTSDVIEEIKSRDGHPERGPVIALSSCNGDGLYLQDSSATLIYRTGYAGAIRKTGRVCVSKPPITEDYDPLASPSIIPD